MDAKDLCFLSASQLGPLIRNKEISPVELVKAHLARIELLEPKLNSFITPLSEEALTAARQAEQEIQKGKYRGPLHGIPLGLKDLYYVKGIPNTSGSKIFKDYIPHFTSTIAAKLMDAGAILIGKLNMHPLAYGAIGGEYGHIRNPWNPECIAGGSSGGSASAVSSGECTLAMGSDTGGSVRLPASLCGIVGFKPNYGRLSRYGLTALGWSQDHPGPMVRTVEDCALIMNAISGYDPHDPVSLDLPVPDYRCALTENIRGLRVGVPKEFSEVPTDPKVKESVGKAIEKLVELGASVREVSWPMFPQSMAIASIILLAEATAYHNKLIRTHGPRIYPPVRLRLEAGFFVSATDYIQAQRARTMFYHQSIEMFKTVDLLAGPTVPFPAFRIDTLETEGITENLKLIPLLSQHTRPFNLIGFPAITVPCGFSDDNLPIGLQLAGRPFSEELVLRTAHTYEQATEWNRRRPPI